MVDSALTILALDGWGQLTSDRVAAVAEVDVDAVRGRWPTMDHLAAEAVRRCVLVPPAPDTGDLATDLATLLEPWTRSLTRDEAAAAALVLPAAHHAELRSGLGHGVVGPLGTCVRAIVEAHLTRGHTATAPRVELLRVVLQSMWWERYLTHHQPMHQADIDRTVELVLLPVLRGAGDRRP